jgi:membrane associated rhomboid family serine protease
VSREEPIFNVPGSVLAVLALLVAVHVLLAALPEDSGTWLQMALAFIPARYSGYAEALPGGGLTAVTSFLTYAVVHASLLHLGLNSAWLVAFGGAVAKRVNAVRFLAFSAFCAIAAAITFLAFNRGLMAPMVGASGAISGLMGATMRFLFSASGAEGWRTLRESPQDIPLMPLVRALTDRRVLAVTGAFILANVLAVLGLGGVSAGGGIAWEAHMGGYFAGLLAFGLFDRTPRAHSPDAVVDN